MSKFSIKKFSKWFFLGLFIACSLTILIESGIDGTNSANQSNAITDQVQDAIDKNHDKNTIKEIEDFSVKFTNANDDNIYYVNDTLTYDFSFTPIDTSFKDVEIENSNSTVLSIKEESKTIVFNNPGVSKITFTSSRKNSLSKEFIFSVKKIDVQEIKIANKIDYNLNIGETYKLETTIFPTNATNTNINYYSSNTKVASIDSNTGTIIAHNGGETTISVVSSDNEKIKDTLLIKVNSAQETNYYIKDVNIKETNQIFTTKYKLITLNGTYNDIYADFDINKLKLTLDDQNNYLNILEKKLTSKGNFSIKISLNENKIEDINQLDNYKIKLFYSYDDLVDTQNKSIELTISKLLDVTINEIDNVNTSEKNLKYIHYQVHENETTIIKDNLKISIPFTIDKNLYNFNYAWEFYLLDGATSYPLDTYFKIIKSYESINLTPISNDLPPKGIVRYIPNVNYNNEYIDFIFSYSSEIDNSSKITDFGFNKFNPGENNKTLFLVNSNDEYNKIFSTFITTSTNTLSSIKNTLVNSKLNIEIIGNESNIAEFIKDELGNYTGIKFNKLGSIKIKLSSEIANDLEAKTYYFESVATPNQASLIVDDITINKSNNNLTINKDQIMIFDAKCSFVTKFIDNTSISIDLTPTLEWKYNNKENNLIFIDETHSIQGLSQTNTNISTRIDFTLKYNQIDITNLLEVSNVNIKVNYVLVNKNIFDFSFTLISTSNEYNKPSDDFLYVPVDTIFDIKPIINDDATNKKVLFSSDDLDLLSIDSETGLSKANKAGTIKITMTSLDDLSISKTKTINIIDTTSPFIIDETKFKPLSIKEIKKDDTISYYDIDLDYGVSYQLYIKPLFESTSKQLSYVNLDEEDYCKHSVYINASGNITTKNIGTDYIKVIYGNPKHNAYTQILHINVIRNTRFTFNQLSLIIRKSLGHFGLFAFTSLLGSIYIFLAFKKDLNKIYATLISMVIGFSLAGFSELIQKFTPGRFCSFRDVLIDSFGYACGVAFTLLIIVSIIIYKNFKSKKIAKDKNKIEN